MSGSSCGENSLSRTRQLCAETTLDHARASSRPRYTFGCCPCLAQLANSGNTTSAKYLWFPTPSNPAGVDQFGTLFEKPNLRPPLSELVLQLVASRAIPPSAFTPLHTPELMSTAPLTAVSIIATDVEVVKVSRSQKVICLHRLPSMRADYLVVQKWGLEFVTWVGHGGESGDCG